MDLNALLEEWKRMLTIVKSNLDGRQVSQGICKIGEESSRYTFRQLAQELDRFLGCRAGQRKVAEIAVADAQVAQAVRKIGKEDLAMLALQLTPDLDGFEGCCERLVQSLKITIVVAQVVEASG